jgi:hypothetical protein
VICIAIETYQKANLFIVLWDEDRVRLGTIPANYGPTLSEPRIEVRNDGFWAIYGPLPLDRLEDA